MKRIVSGSNAGNIGDKRDINETDMQDCLSNDGHISVMMMYMADARSDKRFVDTARLAMVRKPFVVLKSGWMDTDKKVMSPHTASRAGIPVHSTAEVLVRNGPL